MCDELKLVAVHKLRKTQGVIRVLPTATNQGNQGKSLERKRKMVGEVKEKSCKFEQMLEKKAKA